MTRRKKIHRVFQALLAFAVCLAIFAFPLKNTENVATIAEEKNAASQDLQILVDLDDTMLYLFDGNQLLCSFRCAVGKEETHSPLGTFRITRKARWGKGFGGFWMGLDVPWGTYGIHGTLTPSSIGLHASHGCIRLATRDAETLYGLIETGTPVVISEGEFGPFGSSLSNLEYETSGSGVYAVQKRLKELGYYTKNPDGVFGKATLAAFHRFQRDQGIPETEYISVWHLNLLGFFPFE